MEMPITKPSMVSYADEVDFAQLLKKLLNERYNGFIRVTSDSEEGYILFNNGKQVAASYDRLTKSEAVRSIKTAMENSKTLIEMFDLKASQLKYLMDINKPYLMESDYDVYEVIEELKKEDESETEPLSLENQEIIPETEVQGKETEEINNTGVESETKTPTEITPESAENITTKPKNEQASELKSSAPISKEPIPEEKIPEPEKSPDSTESISESADKVSEPVEKSSETAQKVPESDGKVPEIADKVSEPIEQSSEPAEKATKSEQVTVQTSTTEQKETPKTIKEEPATSSDNKITKEEYLAEAKKDELTEVEEELAKKPEKPIDRGKLLEKYGIKEIDEEVVEDILESYKGGAISDDDVEKIEFTLMNKIKKSIFGIPKIKGAEVMVFLENSVELTGNINIIIEYEVKGFLSRLMGESKDIEKLRRQIINIVQIEIKKSFRKYPEIIDNFEINVEIG